jgi:hypothetical protein
MPAHIVKAWGPSTIDLALDVLNSTAAPATAIARWAETVGASPPEAADWLARHAESVRPDVLRVLVHFLDPRDPRLRHVPPSIWKPVVAGDLVGDAFVFVTLLSHPSDGADLLSATFARLHHAAADSALPTEAVTILEPALPDPELAWDMCERLRRAIVGAMADSPDVVRAVSLERELVADLGRTAVAIGGKTLAKKLKLPLPHDDD